ncbi:MAG: phosphoribosylglycinamide formyltransferase [Candidatus Omnitrophota bacterium]
MNIAVFASGSGTNLQAIIDSISRGEIKAKLSLVVSDNKDAFALTRAKNAGIGTFVLSPGSFPSREGYDKEIIKRLERDNIDLIVLAGFMRLVSGYFVNRYKNKIMNIHPALLPSFKGVNAIKDAFESGAKKTGVTVHFIDELMDHGPVILQETVDINENETLKKLEEKIHKVEHKLYPKAVKLFVEGRLRVEGDKVSIKQES